MTTTPLPSWREGCELARGRESAIVEFVARSAARRTESPVEDRIAVFDNDGTLWCEKPMPIQLDFILRRLVVMAEHDADLRTRQPWKAAYEQDYALVGRRHRASTTTATTATCETLAGGVLAAFADVTVEEFEAGADQFLRTARHPTLDRSTSACSYAPMVELLGYLEVNGFRNYIVSGGGRDFMRPISQDVYGIPRERVIGSARRHWPAARRQRRHDHPQAEAGLPRRRPREADADLEPDRPATAAGGGQLQRRHPDAAIRGAPDRPSLRLLLLPRRRRPRVRLHRAAPRRRSNWPRTDGWTVVSIRTTGQRCSDARGGRRRARVVPRARCHRRGRGDARRDC